MVTLLDTVADVRYQPAESLCVSWLFKGCFTSVAGEPMVAAAAGIWDNYNVKKQLLHSW